jgi:hypothetical protein
MIDSLRATACCRITGSERQYGPKALKFVLRGHALIQVNDFGRVLGAGWR